MIIGPSLSVSRRGLIFFSPANLSPELWYDANDGIVAGVGDALTSWTDRQNGVVTNTLSGQSAPVYQATGFNGKPTISFSNINMIEAALALPANRVTLVVVGQIATASEANARLAALIRKSASGDWLDDANLKIERNSTTDLTYASKGNGGSTGQQSVTYDTPSVFIGHADGGDVLYSLNGTETTGTGAAGDLTLAQKLFLGGGWNGSAGAFRLTGKISEILVFDKALNATEREQILAYEKDKWGIA